MSLRTRVRRRLREAAGFYELEGAIDGLAAQLELLETQLHESREDAWERSRTRWRAAQPDRNLTWGAEVSGEAFVDACERHGAFGADKALLEVGPGYGRIVGTCLARGAPFASYLGIDISADNVRLLSERFGAEHVRFLHGDAETVELEEEFDTLLSSLTFKHLWPSFEPVVANLAPRLRAGGRAIFDLIEGDRRYFEPHDRVTYIRWYTRPQVEQILERCGLALEAFDEVTHAAGLTRLLVVARKPA